MVLMPWLALLAAYALWRAYDHLVRVDGGSWAPLGLALVIVAVWATVQPSWTRIADKVENEPRLLAADLDAYGWLHDNTPPGTVVMTRLPWQFNWAADRPALMVPNTASPVRFMMLAKYYHAQYLVRDTLQNPSDQAQQLIDDLVNGSQPVLQEVYRTPPYKALDDKGQWATYRTVIYRFPENYANVAELRP